MGRRLPHPPLQSGRVGLESPALARLLHTLQIRHQLTGPTAMSWRSLENGFPAVRASAIVLCLATSMAGPPAAAQEGQDETNQSVHNRAALTTIPPSPRPGVRPQRPCTWPALAKQSLHRPPEFSQVRRGARRKFAAPEGALGVVNSQGG